MAHGIVRSPRYSTEEASYEVDVEEVYMALTADYDTDVPAISESIIVSDAYTPPWNSPPDILARLVFPGEDEPLDNNWTRAGMEFTQSGGLSNMNELFYDVALKGYLSVQSYRVTNPMPQTMMVEVWSLDAAKADVTRYGLVAIPPHKTRELPAAAIAKKMDNDGGIYFCVRCFLYDEDIADNVIDVDDAGDAFTLPVGDVDPRTATKLGPTIFFNMLNKLDRYGLAVAAIGGGGLAALQQTSLLSERPEVQQAAINAGVNVAELAGIIALGVSEEWITWSDAMEYILPMLGSGLGVGMATYAARRFSTPYSGLLASAGAGAIGFASALALILVIDDAKLDLQA